MKIKLFELRKIIQQVISESDDDLSGALAVIQAAKEKFRASIDVLDDIYEARIDKTNWLSSLQKRLRAFIEMDGEFFMGFEGLSALGEKGWTPYFKQLLAITTQVKHLDLDVASKDQRQMRQLKVAIDGLLGSIVLLFSRALEKHVSDWDKAGLGPMQSYEEDAADLQRFLDGPHQEEPAQSDEQLSPENQALKDKLDDLIKTLSVLKKKGPFKN